MKKIATLGIFLINLGALIVFSCILIYGVERILFSLNVIHKLI